jgi:hypothetical protein
MMKTGFLRAGRLVLTFQLWEGASWYSCRSRGPDECLLLTLP